MSFDKLGDHIWIHVLTFLTPSLPKPLSGLTKDEAYEEFADVIAQLPDAGAPGTTTRRDIRAPELATLMRVSIAFNKLASVPLYKTIITDDYGSLLNFHDGPPAHREIDSRSQLFRYTTNLHLEYCQKGYAGLGEFDRTYDRVLVNPRAWGLVGCTQRDVTMFSAIREVEFLHRIAFDETALDHKITLFPALTRLTVGAIFGGQDAVWVMARESPWNVGTQYNREWEKVSRGTGLRGPLDACKKAMVEMFSKSPITHFCQRGHAGPLSLPQAFHWVDKTSHVVRPTSPLFTFHYTSADIYTLIPAAIGHPNHWLLDQAIPAPAAGPSLYQTIMASYTQVLHARDRLWRIFDCGNDPSKARKATLNLAIHGSAEDISVRSARVAEQDKVLDERRAISRANDIFFEQRNRAPGLKKGEVDDVEWRYDERAPSCLACGWVHKPGVE